MKKFLLGGAAMALAFASYTAYVQPSSAGWGPPFVAGSCNGAAPNTVKINWDTDESTPGQKPAPVAITGITAPKAKETKPENEWTPEQLKAGRPTLVYYFLADAEATNDDSYKFCRKLEMSAFGGDSVEIINKNFIAKKREVDIDADRKLEKNQARIEFWSFTGKKIDVVSLKEQQLLNPSPFSAKLKEVVAKNREICNAEIKRMADEQQRRKQAALDAAVK